MRKITWLTAAIILSLLITCVVYAGIDVSGHTYTTLAVSTSATNGTTTTAAVDVSGVKGIGKIIVFDSGDIGIGVSTQQVVTVQHSTTGTSSWANVTAPTFADAATNATIEAETIDTQTLRKYIRLQMTLNSTTNVQHYFGGVMVTHR